MTRSSLRLIRELRLASPAGLLQHVLRDEVQRGRVVLDGRRYRLNTERFDPAVLAALKRLGQPE